MVRKREGFEYIKLYVKRDEFLETSAKRKETDVKFDGTNFPHFFDYKWTKHLPSQSILVPLLHLHQQMSTIAIVL